MAVVTDNNPFFNRGCIEDAKYFIGRKRELKEIFSLLDKPTPQSCSVVGQRKIGKSSLLAHINRPEVMAGFTSDPEKLVLIYINFEGLAYLSEIECLQKIIWETHSALARHEINMGEEFKIDLSTATPFRIIEALGRVFRYLRQQGKRPIYLFDEFEISCYNPHLSISFFNTLRSFATSFGVAYVVATKQELWKLPHYRMGRSSPFFNYFTTLYLGLFKEDEAREFLRGLTAGTGVSLEEEESFILRRTGPFPFFMQILCWYLWEKKAEIGSLKEQHLQEADRQFLTQASPYFDFYWEYLTDEEREVAGKLAQGRAVLESEASLLDSLERKALLIHKERSQRLFSESFTYFAQSALQSPAGKYSSNPPA
jgi:AAA+ ATPase superfamily predicted ATPase